MRRLNWGASDRGGNIPLRTPVNETCIALECFTNQMMQVDQRFAEQSTVQQLSHTQKAARTIVSC